MTKGSVHLGLSLLTAMYLVGCSIYGPLNNPYDPNHPIPPGTTFVYASDANNNTVYGFTVGSTGDVTALPGSPYAAGSFPEGVAVTPDGRYLYVADQGQGISEYSIGSDGTLTALSGSPLNVAQYPVAASVTPDGKFLYVTCNNALLGFSIGSTGVLSPVPGSPYAKGGWGIAISPTGAVLYQTNSSNDTISAYAIGTNGSLSPVSGSPFAAGANAYGIVVTPDGSHLYVGNTGISGAPGAVSAYAIKADGSIAPITGSPFSLGSGGGSELAISADGKYLYATTGSVVVMSINSTGGLNSLGSVAYPGTIGASVTGIAVLPYSYYVYTSGSHVIGYRVGSGGLLSGFTNQPLAVNGAIGFPNVPSVVTVVK